MRSGLGDIREDLSVELDVRFLRSIDELAVSGSQIADSCVDLHQPKGPVVALLLLASLEGMAPGVEQSFLCRTFLRLASPFESLHIGEQFFSFFVGDDTPFYSSHSVSGLPNLTNYCVAGPVDSVTVPVSTSPLSTFRALYFIQIRKPFISFIWPMSR